MRKISVLLIALLFMGAGAVWGQGRTISGKVVDSDSGEPLIGASVEVLGAQTGTSTDINGAFTLTLPDGYTTLKVEQTSYTTMTVEAKDGMVIRLVLTGEMLETAEIEVAMNTKKGKGYVGSAQTISEATIEKKSPSDVTKAFAGEFAGVQVATTTGQPGVTASVRIRGASSLNAGGGVLYVVDGVPYGSDISAIDPGDIVNSTVLKDATATSMYGARGSNGVILITTKKGTAGTEGKINVDLKVGANLKYLPTHDIITNPEEYMELSTVGLFNFWQQTILPANGFTNTSIANTASLMQSSNAIWNEQLGGMNSKYNMWKTNDIIDYNTGKFKEGVQRRYTPASWEKNMFHTGMKYDIGVKMSGGSDKTTYYTSINFLNDEGYYIQSDFKRLTALSNVDYSPKKWLTANLKMSYAYSTMNAVGQSSTDANNGFYFVNTAPPIYSVFQHNPDGSIKQDPILGGNAYDYGQYIGYSRPFMPGINPAGALQLDRNFTVAHNVALSNSMKFEFVKDLLIIITNGYNYQQSDNTEMTNSLYGDGAGVGRITKYISNYIDFTSRQQISYKKTFADVHNFDIMIGHDFRNQEVKSLLGNKANTFKPGDITLSNAVNVRALEGGAGDYRAESYIGELRYNYSERYFAILNASHYGSSYFAPGYRFGTFWSFGLSWNIHRELFMASAKSWLSNLKVKASFGTTGNDQIGNYNYWQMYGLGSVGGLPAITWSSIAEPTLTWETSYKFNTGIEFDIFKGRLYGEIEYYNDLTVNNLDTRAIAPSIGYGSIPINQGKYRNYGVEVLLKSNVVKTRNFEMNLRLTGAHIGTEMVELPKEYIKGQWVEMAMNGNYAKGHSRDDIYSKTFLGVDPTNGWGIWETHYDQNGANPNQPVIQPYLYTNKKTVDENGNVVLANPNANLVKGTTNNPNEASYTYIGKGFFPDFYGGFGLDFSTHGFEFAAMFNYIIGGYNNDVVYANLMADGGFGTKNFHKDALKAWSPYASAEHNQSTNIPAYFAGIYGQNADGDVYFGSYSGYGDRFLTSNTGLQLSNVRLGYNFPKKWVEKLQLNNLNIWVMGDNLLVLSKRRGYNPFAGLYGGNAVSQYQPLSTVMGGIKFSF